LAVSPSVVVVVVVLVLVLVLVLLLLLLLAACCAAGAGAGAGAAYEGTKVQAGRKTTLVKALELHLSNCAASLFRWHALSLSLPPSLNLAFSHVWAGLQVEGA
jgi:hypothetical protein